MSTPILSFSMACSKTKGLKRKQWVID